MRLLLAANNQATRRNEIIKSYLQLGSSSNRYAPRLPQQETKSSTKQLPPTGPILGPENILKTGFAQKGLPSTYSCKTTPVPASCHISCLFVHPVQEIQAGKISVRSDILKQMFDFYDQISASCHYPSLEQTNLQARGIGNNINFWNRLRAICPEGVMYNGPILNSQGDHCTTSRMLDEAMLVLVCRTR